MRPRILLFSTAYLPHIGGSELAIYHIARFLPDYDIDLVTGRLDSSDATMEYINRVRVFRAGGRWSRLSLLVPKFLMPIAMAITAYRLTKKYRYSVLHAYQASQAAVAAAIVNAFCPSIPLIITLQEGKILKQQPWLTQTIRAFILRRARMITAISNYLADYAGSVSRAPVVVIPNGVDVGAMYHPEIVRDAHRIVTVSRLVEKNNVEGILRAMVHVRERFPLAKLLIAGDGPMKASLMGLSSDLGIAGSVEFRGFVAHKNLGEILSSASIFARPSLSEGLGSAFLEAMAAHTAIVASSVGGIPDIVEDGVTGLLCDPRNPHDIARAIMTLLEQEQTRTEIVERADAFVKKYDWSSIAWRMSKLYASIA
ncbi:MAG: glycosyltransferase family 4 protein [Candidatus Pacebacteria bacterium]|nr:glycosyltransferase family 4 protein [Candidatus Paceibacterota bacterium]